MRFDFVFQRRVRTCAALAVAISIAVATAAPGADVDISKLPPAAARTINFAKDIQPLFRPKDINSMKSKFNLADYNDVRQFADAIYSRLHSGSMPCDGAWSPDKVQLFKNWIDGGKLP